MCQAMVSDDRDWSIRIRRLRITLKPTVGDLKTRDRQAISWVSEFACAFHQSLTQLLVRGGWVWIRVRASSHSYPVSSSQNLLASRERLWLILKLSRAVYDRLVSTTSQSGGVWSTERFPVARKCQNGSQNTKWVHFRGLFNLLCFL